MALYLVLRDNAPSGPGTAVACRCCPAGSRSTRARRYPSDMTDAEWAVIEPLLPAPGWMLGQGGSPGIYCRRDIVNAIRYLTHNGPVWRALPADLPHWRTVYGYVRDWQASGATRRMHDELREAVRVLRDGAPWRTAQTRALSRLEGHIINEIERCSRVVVTLENQLLPSPAPGAKEGSCSAVTSVEAPSVGCVPCPREKRINRPGSRFLTGGCPVIMSPRLEHVLGGSLPPLGAEIARHQGVPCVRADDPVHA
jgi:transposase